MHIVHRAKIATFDLEKRQLVLFGAELSLFLLDFAVNISNPTPIPGECPVENVIGVS